MAPLPAFLTLIFFRLLTLSWGLPVYLPCSDQSSSAGLLEDLLLSSSCVSSVSWSHPCGPVHYPWPRTGLALFSDSVRPLLLDT